MSVEPTLSYFYAENKSKKKAAGSIAAQFEHSESKRAESVLKKVQRSPTEYKVLTLSLTLPYSMILEQL